MIANEEQCEVDGDELKEKMEQFHRESRKIPKRRMDIDRAYKEKLSQATDVINKTCLPR